ncbi:MAG: YceI family protein [Ktedonobacterales bacterium]
MSWLLDTAHSQISFSVKHMMISTVRGRFTAFSGTFDINEDNPAASSFEVAIDMASASTGDANRDGHLKNADFFDVEKYPTATYKSTRIEKINDSDFRIYGDLTLHGVTHEVPLSATLEGRTKDMQGNWRAGFTVSASLSRKDFDLNWNVALESGGVLVSDKVGIEIDAQMIERVPVTA